MVESVVMPRPPNWISVRITRWPNVEKSLQVSRTVRPVTHTALVAVNSASNNGIRASDADNGQRQHNSAQQDRRGKTR